MIKGLKITQQGDFMDFEYHPLNIHMISYNCENRGLGEIKMLETFYNSSGDVNYIVYGWNAGLNFNSFDIDECNAYGDILIICIDNETDNYVNVNTYEIERHYTPIDLDATIIEDELSYSSDEYEFNEDWIDDDINNNTEESDNEGMEIDYP